jgi:hypothetical protein
MYSRVRHHRIHLYPYELQVMPYWSLSYIGSSPMPIVPIARIVQPRPRKILLVPLCFFQYDTMRTFQQGTT